eukprot:5085072-Alexandrium_andersonii.AAC.1
MGCPRSSGAWGGRSMTWTSPTSARARAPTTSPPTTSGTRCTSAPPPGTTTSSLRAPRARRSPGHGRGLLGLSLIHI